MVLVRTKGSPSHLGVPKRGKRWKEMPDNGTEGRDSFAETILENARSYCLSTSLHGFSYVVTGASTAERVIWFGVCALYFVLGGIVVNQAFADWTENPVITSIDTFSHPVQQIEYPAIAICPKDNYDPWAYVKNAFKEPLNCGEGGCGTGFKGFLEKLGKHLGTSLQRIQCDTSWDSGYCYQYYEIKKFQQLAIILGKHEATKEMFQRHLSRFLTGTNASSDIEELLSVKFDTTDSNDIMVKLDETDAYEEFTGYGGMAGSLSWSSIKQCVKKLLKKQGQGRNSTLRESFQRRIYKKCLERETNDTLGEIGNFSDMEFAIIDACVMTMTYSHSYCMSGWNYYVDIESWCTEKGCNETLKEDLMRLANGIIFSFKQPLPETMGRLLKVFGDNFYATPESQDDQVLRGLLGNLLDPADALVHPRDLAKLFNKQADPATIPASVKRIQRSAVNVFLPVAIMFLKNGLYLARNEDQAANSSSYGLVIPVGNDIGDFLPTMTEYGLCEVHNVRPFPETYKSMPTMPVFQEVLNMHEENVTIRNIPGSGKSFERSVWINIESHRPRCNQETAVIQGTCSDKSGYVTVGINHWLNFFALDTLGIIVPAGMETIVKVKPIIHITSDSFRELPLESRKCRFTGENPNEKSLFSYYTQKSCFFECSLSYAARLLNCTPWEFPHPRSESGFGICTSVDGRLMAFFEALADTRNMANCHCLPDCEETNYELEVTGQPLTSGEFCSDVDSRERQIAMDHFWRSWDFATWWYHGAEGRFDGSEYDVGMTEWDVVKMCEKQVEEKLAMLTVSIPSPTAMRVKKSRRVTFTDQLGMFGGTIGLFTGLSLVSVTEVVYWIYRTARSFLEKLESKGRGQGSRKRRRPRLKIAVVEEGENIREFNH